MWCWTLTMCLSALTWADLTTALVFLAVFVLVLYGMSSPGTRIPGPFALPIVGNLFMFVRKRQRSHIELLKLKEKYGDVFRLYIGPFRLIVISGYENIHEAFVRHGTNLGHRPNWLPDIKARSETYGYGECLSIIWINQCYWCMVFTRPIIAFVNRRIGIPWQRNGNICNASKSTFHFITASPLPRNFALKRQFGNPVIN